VDKTSGGVKCWGYNSSGQVGDNSTTQRTTPVNVSGLTSGVSAIAVGDFHTCALTTSGGVKCWGNNSNGQLGNNSTSNSSVPVDVSSLTSGVTAITAGGSHTCALLSTGGVKCWGRNGQGQLGDGTTTQRLTPVDVNGLTSGVSYVFAGYRHTCALTSGGGVKCWGLNDKRQLGDGTTTQRLTPVAVTGITSNGSSMTMGYAHSCAKVIGGGLKCWGSNSDGQLSDNTVTYSTTPLVIGFTGYTYAYDSTHKHAATSLSSGETYTYAANGNTLAPGATAGVTTRVENGVTYTQNYDAENRLISVNVTGQSLPTLFIYDGDGNLVKQIKPDNSKTLYVGGIYEVNKNAGGSVTGTKTYYPAAGAMRDGSTLYYVLKDHLGSASVLTNSSGGIVAGADTRYYPFGEARFSTSSMVTDKLFTGQRQIAELGIYHYGARFYSPKLGRFLSADTIVPRYAYPQSLNRFSYVVNNPLKYTDPTGHMMDDGNHGEGGHCDRKCIKRLNQERKHKKNKDKNEADGGGGHPLPSPALAAPDPDVPIACDWFDCALSAVSLIATVAAAVPGTIGVVGFGVDLVATVWAIGRTNDDYRQGEISKTRQYTPNITGIVGVLPGGLLGKWGFAVSFTAGLANLLVTATGLPN
jgi:RHS repeat-associated protein